MNTQDNNEDTEDNSKPIEVPRNQFEIKLPPLNRRHSFHNPIENLPSKIHSPDIPSPRQRATSISEGLISVEELPYVTIQHFTFAYLIAKGGMQLLFK